MKTQAMTIIEEFEQGRITEAAAVAKLEELTRRTVAPDWLRNYWRSESVEDFVDRLCAQPIEHWQQITEPEAQNLIEEFLRTQSPGRQDSIGTALERRYGKPTGTLTDLVFQQGLDDSGKILRELKEATRIYL